jgi:hypothetical protein
MTNNKLDSSDLKSINILHKAFLIGQLLFIGIAFYLVYFKLFQATEHQLEKPLQFIAIILSIGGFFAGSQIFKKRLADSRQQNNVKEKFELYRGACIIQWALLEGPCLFNIISFMMTGDYTFLYLAGALILTFVRLSPSKIKLVDDLQLSDEEATDL